MNGHLAQKEGDGRDGLSRIYIIQREAEEGEREQNHNCLDLIFSQAFMMLSDVHGCRLLNHTVSHYTIYEIYPHKSDRVENSLRKAENDD